MANISAHSDEAKCLTFSTELNGAPDTANQDFDLPILKACQVKQEIIEEEIEIDSMDIVEENIIHVKSELTEHENEIFDIGKHDYFDNDEFPEESPMSKGTNTTLMQIEKLSLVERSYLEKCKAMINMYNSLRCACHSKIHPNLRGLMSHLRSVKIWFPVSTCYHCMITFKDKTSRRNHGYKCPNNNLDKLKKLSYLNERSSMKTRIYQNYRCVECELIFYFHEDFCRHIDEEHCENIASNICACQQTFDSSKEFRDHLYVSCWLEYYCDLCNSIFKTMIDFIIHSENEHDSSEELTLFQVEKTSEISEQKSRKNKRKISNETVDEIEDNRYSASPPNQPRKRKNIPTKCSQCFKVYSSRANMLRHFRIHQETVAQQGFSIKNSEDSYYMCPDCKIMYNELNWELHKKSHKTVKCSVCNEIFLFRAKLEEHVKIHFNSSSNQHSSEEDGLQIPPTNSPIKNENEYYCDICDKRFCSKRSMSTHQVWHRRKSSGSPQINKHNNPKQPFECEECGQALPNQVALNIHSIEKHGNVAAFLTPRCECCNQEFGSQTEYENHIKLHEIVELPNKVNNGFSCQQCPASFKTSDTLMAHIKIRHQPRSKVAVYVSSVMEEHSC